MNDFFYKLIKFLSFSLPISLGVVVLFGVLVSLLEGQEDAGLGFFLLIPIYAIIFWIGMVVTVPFRSKDPQLWKQLSYPRKIFHLFLLSIFIVILFQIGKALLQ